MIEQGKIGIHTSRFILGNEVRSSMEKIRLGHIRGQALKALQSTQSGGSIRLVLFTSNGSHLLPPIAPTRSKQRSHHHLRRSVAINQSQKSYLASEPAQKEARACCLGIATTREYAFA